MTKRSVFAWIAVVAGFLGAAGCSSRTGTSGEALFKERCAACHPNGGNTVNSRKTLHKKDLEANYIRTPGDIVARMRNPGVGMPRFDKNVIPERDARKIARYILSTFK